MRIEFQIDNVSDAQLADRIMAAISTAFGSPARKVSKQKDSIVTTETTADTSNAEPIVEKQIEVTDATVDPVEQYNRLAAAAGVARVESAKEPDVKGADVAKVEAPAETVAQSEPAKGADAATPSREDVYEAVKGRVIEKGALWARSQYAKAGVKKLSDMTVEQLLALKAELDGAAS